ncbi:MAG: DUF6591 domain-containing protein [Bacteroidota bacterium]
MKKLITVTFLFAMIIMSCSNNKSKSAESAEDPSQKSVNTESLEKAKNCDEFIDQYEKWMDDYLKLLEKYMKNPMDQTLAGEYMKVAQESMEWVENWSRLSYCASKKKYEKRFNEISERAEKKMEELGLE